MTLLTNELFLLEEKWDQYQYLGNCPSTPPLTQKQPIDNKVGLMLGWGRGRWAVAQILILIRKMLIGPSISQALQ